MIGYLRKKVSLFKTRYFGLRIRLTIDPFKVAGLWRKIGVEIGEGTCIYRDVHISSGSEPIKIGKNCVLTGCTILAHDASTNRELGIKYGEMSPMLPVIIGDDCFIGYGSIILMGVSIGEGSIVGAGAVVTKDVPSRSVVAGNPARIIMTTDELVERREELIFTHPEVLTTNSDHHR